MTSSNPTPQQAGSAAAAGAENYLETVHRNKGLGSWRSLYLELLQTPPLRDYRSIIEIGAGSPDFLLATSAERRVAVDISDKYRETFEAAGIGFLVRNLDREDLSGEGSFDVAVCSDVFEHLLNPQVALRALKDVLTPCGLLFSHVPNEYRLKTTLRIMLGRQEGLYFHTDENEWTDPHLRRFTDLGFRRFLRQAFRYNVKLTPLRYQGLARRLQRTGFKVPFCLEGGPTYASTDSEATHAKILEAVKHL
jgi:SAM-dependent methyltransferase